MRCSFPRNVDVIHVSRILLLFPFNDRLFSLFLSLSASSLLFVVRLRRKPNDRGKVGLQAFAAAAAAAAAASAVVVVVVVGRGGGGRGGAEDNWTVRNNVTSTPAFSRLAGAHEVAV